MAILMPTGYPPNVHAEALAIDGVWLFTPVQHADDRGVFLESFTSAALHAATGRVLELAQMNISVSRRGSVRGIHFADVPPGQAKYVQCLTGAVLDIVVDIRIGSPTFGTYVACELNSSERQGLFVSEGLGHGFCALAEEASVGYLCSTPYAPGREHGINPLDPALNLPWPTDIPGVLSDKDRSAPNLAEAAAAGLLPTLEACVTFARGLRS